MMWLWWSCLLTVVVLGRALEQSDLFEFGPGAGDDRLQPDSDSTAELHLQTSVFFFGGEFDKVYINTNGFVAFTKPPPEHEYLGKMPATFKMIAVLLGDLDNSDGRGSVYFRQDSSPEVLRRAGEHMERAFPGSIEVKPVDTFVVTWENIAAAGSSGRGDGLDDYRNTFQLVVASTKDSSYAILMFPQHGVQFLSTTLGGVLETGFNEGLVESWFWSTRQGLYFRSSTNEDSSIRNLPHKTTSGKKGVWVYEIGSSSSFGITPGTASDLPEEEEVTKPLVTMIPRQPEQDMFRTVFHPHVVPEKQQELLTQTPTLNPISNSEHETFTTLTVEELVYKEPDQTDNTNPQHVTATPTYTDRPNPTYLDPSRPSFLPDQTQAAGLSQPLSTIDKTTEPSHPTMEPVSQDPGVVERQPTLTNSQPARPGPPHFQPHPPGIVVVDEDLEVNVFTYSLETCAHNRHKCSPFANCQDHSNGYCCHCRPGFYGNGKNCIAEGKPQRINGKVNGRLFVGNSSSPEELRNHDLHSYVVANEGRTYMAISNVDARLGPSLRLLPALGGAIGWTFALEQPGYQNGFSIVGGEFTRQAEVVFHPGHERLSITQQFKGINEHDHLVVNTKLEGRLPAVPPGSSILIHPYHEIYHYDPNLIMSSSSRDFTITLPDGTIQNQTYQCRQQVVFESCPHDELLRPAPSTQQLSVEQIFVMFDPENDLMRYAMTTKMGSVYTGRSQEDKQKPDPGSVSPAVVREEEEAVGRGVGPDTNILTQWGEGASPQGLFIRTRVKGYKSAESLPVDQCQAGSHDCDVPERAFCRYTGGSSYICSCMPGFVGDGRVCRDDDECLQGQCHLNATCLNTPGSYMCHCNPGFHGDGFQCIPTERHKSQCERHRESAQAATPTSGLLAFFRPHPVLGQYVPQCDTHGAYESIQCHGSIGQCWCVDANGQEIPNTRTGPGSTPLCIEQSVIPTPVGPTPRPDVVPVSLGTHLLFAQSGKIEHIPMDGYHMKMEEAKPLLHIPDRVIVAVAFDCVEKMVYWSDITAPTISRASMGGGDVSAIITEDLESPEGIAVDHVSRLLFWTDSVRDTVEVSQLDGSQRRVLFHTGLVNPRPIITNPVYGQLYWADWNRDGPKIEMSNMDGTDRTVLVKDDLGLPNGLTFDLYRQQLCWADAGTHKVECMDLHRRSRTSVVEGVQYPFALVSFGRNLYYTDWRREALIAVDRHSRTETEEFLPQRRSRLYGVTATLMHCPQVYNYCSNNGGCSHLCLPRLGGFTCRCPDTANDVHQCRDGKL